MSLQYEVLPLYNLSTISSVAPTSGPANGRASFVLTGSSLKVSSKRVVRASCVARGTLFY